MGGKEGEINARTTHQVALVIITVLIIIGSEMGAVAYPHFPGTANTIGQPGMSALMLSVTTGSEASLTITRAITPQLDVSLRVRPNNLFTPSLHAALINAFGLITIGADVAPDAITAIAGLFLGPVRIDWARDWPTAARWWLVTWSPRPGMSVAAGMAWGNAPTQLVAQLTLFRHMRWLTVSLSDTTVRFTVGEVF